MIVSPLREFRLTLFTVSYTSGSCAIVSDIMALIVTWYKTFSTIKLARQARIQAPLSALLLRDGKLMLCSVHLNPLYPSES